METVMLWNGIEMIGYEMYVKPARIFWGRKPSTTKEEE
jgi:hypothetical protein